MDLYVYVPSNMGDFVDNTLSNFRVKLPTKIDLTGEWEVALVEVSYPITWLNIGSEQEGLVLLQLVDPIEYPQKTIPYNNYNSIDDLCNAISFTLDNMHSFPGDRVNFNFQYDNIRHRIGLKPLSDVAAPNVNILRLSPQLQCMLGFKNLELGLTSGKIKAVFKNSREVVSDSIECDKIKWSTKSDEENIKMFQDLNSHLDSFTDAEDSKIECNLRYMPPKAEMVLEGSDSNIIQLNLT